MAPPLLTGHRSASLVYDFRFIELHIFHGWRAIPAGLFTICKASAIWSYSRFAWVNFKRQQMVLPVIFHRRFLLTLLRTNVSGVQVDFSNPSPIWIDDNSHGRYTIFAEIIDDIAYIAQRLYCAPSIDRFFIIAF